MDDRVLVVWCDSPSNKISLRVHSSGEPVLFTYSTLPDGVQTLSEVEEVFEVLRKRDGTKIAVPYGSIELLFGWTI